MALKERSKILGSVVARLAARATRAAATLLYAPEKYLPSSGASTAAAASSSATTGTRAPRARWPSSSDGRKPVSRSSSACARSASVVETE